MMASRVAFCVDGLTARNPGLVGLDGEVLDAQDWLEVFVSGEEARRGIGDDAGFAEAWIASCEDVDPINLAATIKSDHPDLPVRLVVREGCGSLFSRAHTASIDEVLDQDAFPRRYVEAKRNFGACPREDGPASSSATPVAFAASSANETGAGVVDGDLGSAHAGLLTPTVLARPADLVVTRRRGFVMPIVSGSGGAGKSTVSVMSALIAREMGHRTLLLDYDLQFGDVAAMAGIDDALTVDEALAHPDRFEREMQRDPLLTVLAAPSRLEQGEEVVKSIPDLLDGVSGLFDVVVANTGGAWAEQHAVLLERSYVALFLIDQRASSIRACRHALELCERCGIASGPFEFALNRCAKGAPLTAADVSCALEGAPVYELKEGGRDVEDYLGAGGAFELLQSSNELCSSLRLVMERLLPDRTLPAVLRDDEAPERRSPRRRGRHVSRKRGRKS